MVPFRTSASVFLVGAIFTTIALILMPNAGLFLSPGTETAILSPVLIGAGMLMIMDASINVTMEPFRALVGICYPMSSIRLASRSRLS